MGFRQTEVPPVRQQDVVNEARWLLESAEQLRRGYAWSFVDAVKERSRVVLLLGLFDLAEQLRELAISYERRWEALGYRRGLG